MATNDNLINFLKPSSDSSESLYKQLSRSLNNAIQEGLLSPGDATPHTPQAALPPPHTAHRPALGMGSR